MCSAEAAREKVVICTPQGETAVYQADRHSRSAALCACGNATAAAAALLAVHGQRTEVRQKLQLPDGQVKVSSRVVSLGSGGWRVQQARRDIQFDVQATTLLGRQVAVCTGSFNDYLIVPLPDPTALAKLDLSDALALWDAARSACGFDCPLRRPGGSGPGRVAPAGQVLHLWADAPGHPLTGLATLALAADQVDWLAALLPDGRIQHRRGIDDLPAIQRGPQTRTVRFAPIDVVLASTSTLEAAA